MQTTDVRDAALDAVDQSKSFVNRQIEQRSSELGERIGEVAQDLRGVGDQLRRNGTMAPAASYVDQGAEAVERFGRYLRDADAEQLFADAEDLARRQPWLVASAAFAVGFGAARFLKTSSARRAEASSYAT